MELGAALLRGESQLPFALLFGPVEHPLEKELTEIFALCPGAPHGTACRRLLLPQFFSDCDKSWCNSPG